MGTKAFFTKKWPTRLGYFIAKWSPPFIGRMIVGVLARIGVMYKPDVYWTSMDNYSHIYKHKTQRELHQCVYKQFFNTFRCYYEFFHNMGRRRTQLQHFDPPVKITSDTMRYINEALASGRGLLILGCHMANFDLGGIALSQYIPEPMQALSLASPPAGFEFFNNLREYGNGIVTPINTRTLRDAIARLKRGGIVLTGIDRPIAKGNEEITFFEDTAYLPTGYIRLALLTDCLVMTTSFYYENNAYWIEGFQPFEVSRTGKRELDRKTNAERALSQVETHIMKDPTQWMMFLPVWQADNAKSVV